MSQQKSQARNPLEVTIMFEPSRLAAMHLVDAYSQVVPLRRRATSTPGRLSPRAMETQSTASRQGGQS